MVRTILAVIAGVVAWLVIATVIDIGLRHVLEGYAAAEPVLDFTLTMKIARLTLAVIASLGAGYTVRMIAPSSNLAPWLVGGLFLVFFVPEHIRIGARLPLWYHLFFLITLAPLVALGARLRGRAQGQGRSEPAEAAG